MHTKLHIFPTVAEELCLIGIKASSVDLCLTGFEASDTDNEKGTQLPHTLCETDTVAATLK